MMTPVGPSYHVDKVALHWQRSPQGYSFIKDRKMTNSCFKKKSGDNLPIEQQMKSHDPWEKVWQMLGGFSQTGLMMEKPCVSLIQPH